MNAQSKDTSRFFIILAVVFGLAVRLYPVLKADFPLVDGGMFYTMIRDLQTAHFSLPVFTTYNQLQIPYAYPPLGFYLAGFLNSITGISILKIIQWLPVMVNILTIPFFYSFTKRILNSESRAALATLIYVLTPNSYWWTIVGGGLTRSLGTFFFIVTALCVYQMYREKKMIWAVASIFAGAFVVLSHLSWALQTVVVVILLWFFFGKDKQGSINSLIVAFGVLLLTSPWWITVIAQHGVGVFAQAFQVNHSRWLSWTILFALSFTGEYTTVIAVFALIGLFIHLAKRNYFFALWALLCLLSDPRGGTYASIFPFAVLAMSAITDGVAPNFIKSNPENPEAWTYSLNSRAGKLFFGFFVILFLYNAYSVSNKLSQEVLNSGQREALEWVRKNTASTDAFLVLDEQGNPLLSPFVEWFPALSERHCLTTIQGTEWLSGVLHYNAQMPVITSIRACLYQGVECVKIKADYIVISSQTRVPLLVSLEDQPDFKLVYSSSTVKIFKTR
jgi:hypothetical protein